FGTRRNVIATAGPHGFNGSHDLLFLLVADAPHFAVNLLRGGRAAAGRVDVQDDGADGIVSAEFAQLLDHGAGIEDEAFNVNHADLVAEARELAAVAAPHTQA